MTAIVRGNALAIPLGAETVDLIVESPPYFAQRSYKDGGEHYDGQIGSEPHPQLFLEALWAQLAEWWRVLKPGGSVFVNLGDKRSGSGAPGTTSGLGGSPQGNRTGMGRSVTSGSEAGSTLEGTPQQRRAGARARAEAAARSAGGSAGVSYTRAAFGRAKSRQLLPERFVIGCQEGLADPCVRDHEHVGPPHPVWLESECCRGQGWIVRQIIVWEKPNGLPESVRDRTRDNFEVWYHLTKSGAYYAAIDELREPHTGGANPSGPNAAVTSWGSGHGDRHRTGRCDPDLLDPRGKLPGSVWRIATEPLKVPDHLGVEHYAAFPSEWPRRLILGWSPPGWCTACGEPRRPVVEVEHDKYRAAGATGRPKKQELGGSHGGGMNVAGYPQTTSTATITGYACACPDTSAPTTPAVVLDPFGGTGTTAMVARALGRTGISLDLSADYCRLAKWRVFESPGAQRAAARTLSERQGALL